MIPPIVVDGIAYAGAIALMACGVTLIYICTKTFNFSHASMTTWGLYIVYTGVMLHGGTPYQYLPLAFLFGGLLGAICYLCINGPLLRRGASPTTLMMSTLGYEFVLLSTVQIYTDYLTRTFKLYARMTTLSIYDSEILGVRAITLVSFMIAIGTLIILHTFLVKTKFGIALRVTVENPSLASIIGINSERVYMASWILGGGLASLGGAAASLVLTGTPVMGWLIIVTMFAASILGGLYSIYGGTIAGYIVGVVEYVGIYFLASAIGSWVTPYRPVIPLIIMAITLLTLPEGLASLPWGSLAPKIVEVIKIGGKESSEKEGGRSS